MELSPRASDSNDEGLLCHGRTQQSVKFLSMMETVATVVLPRCSRCRVAAAGVRQPLPELHSSSKALKVL